MREIPRILAIEPNPDRAHALAHLVHDYVEADVVLSASADVALAVMTGRMPELILLSAFVPPGDEQSLMTFLRQSAHASVPVLIMSSSLEQLLKKPSKSSGIPWLSLRRSAAPTDMMRDTLGARVRGALEESREQRRDASSGSVDTVTVRKGHVPIPRTRRWSAPDGSALSLVRLESGFAGRLMDISSSGLLLESESILMPGNAVVFEFADPHAELKRIWHPDMNPTVLADVIRSEVSKIAPDRFRYRVAARFVEELALLADTAVDRASPLPDKSAGTPVEGDDSMRARAARLRELARALESFQSAIVRMCPPTSEATRTN